MLCQHLLLSPLQRSLTAVVGLDGVFAVELIKRDEGLKVRVLAACNGENNRVTVTQCAALCGNYHSVQSAAQLVGGVHGHPIRHLLCANFLFPLALCAALTGITQCSGATAGAGDDFVDFCVGAGSAVGLAVCGINRLGLGIFHLLIDGSRIFRLFLRSHFSVLLSSEFRGRYHSKTFFFSVVKGIYLPLNSILLYLLILSIS